MLDGPFELSDTFVLSSLELAVTATTDVALMHRQRLPQLWSTTIGGQILNVGWKK